MTQAEFDTIRPLVRMTPERLESARLALVDGLTLEAAGLRRPGPKPYTRQAVADAVRIVVRAQRTYQQTQLAAETAGTVLPEGWERVTLIAPSPLVEEFRQRVALALEAAAAPAKRRARRTLDPITSVKARARPKLPVSGLPGTSKRS